ncbi:MAG: site-specific integrase, partial [Gammaproteobacteria bacterium]|nr:site-specific integrase [Gammaproteobacteria bacterium]
TRLALRFLLLTFVRPGELRGARWEEIDLDAKEWRIPAKRMKMKTEHIVPLSKQAISVLEELQSITGQYELIFPGERSRHRPMSENTLLFALYRMGYKNRATPHGFRATASSILNEQNFNRDAIERQLSHQERNQVRGAYTHHAEYLKERKKIMQWWADYLEDMEHDTNVIKGNFN